MMTKEAPATSASKTAWRVAAVMLLVTVISNFVQILLNTEGTTSRLVTTIVIDLVLMAGLWIGLSWARTWALWRAGVVLLPILLITQHEYALAITQLAVTAACCWC